MASTTNGFARLLLPALGLCLVALTILRSYAVVDGTNLPDPHNYYLSLDVKEAALENKLKKVPSADLQETMRQAALVAWQNNKIELAEPYLKEIWEEHQSNNTTTYDQTFVQDGLNLAGLYLDRGSHALAILIYARLFGYDCAHLPPTDARIGRDLNNLGLCYLQAGESTPNWKARKEWFAKAITEWNKAEKIFRSKPQYEPQLIYNLQNQVVAYSEMGDSDKALALSNIVNKKLDAWHDEQNAKAESRI